MIHNIVAQKRWAALVMILLFSTTFSAAAFRITTSSTSATRQRCRTPSSSTTRRLCGEALEESVGSTRYTINNTLCPPTQHEVLSKVVTKHCRTLDSYLVHKPIASHTQEAFDQVQDHLLSTTSSRSNTIILDSGCGTARSTLMLASMYPDHTVIGVDRSLARLNRNVAFRRGDELVREDNDDETSSPLVQTMDELPNVLLVRAELSDFWRLCLESTSISIAHHYLLYPNPYPKPKRLQSRWYGHPSFPIMLQLGGHLHVRSNWKGYLDEFARSVLMADEYWREHDAPNNFASLYVEAAEKGPIRRYDTSIAWTNFEQKYDDCGEPTYVLDLYMSNASSQSE